MGERVSETTLCWYQIVQTERGTFEWPRIQPIGCPGEHVSHGQSDAIGNGTCGLGCALDAHLCCWDWEGKSMIVGW
jgi:hypothetical protein